MVFSSIIYTLLFIVSFILLIDSTNATSLSGKDGSGLSDGVKAFDEDSDGQDDTSSLSKNQALEHNAVYPDEYYGLLFGKRQTASRGIRFPSESILLGKRRLPSEPILLGKRRLPAEPILLGKRRLPSESILLGKRK